MSSEEKFFRVKASSDLDYGGCYYEGDSPSVEQKLEVEQYDDPIEMMRVMLKEQQWRFEELLEEVGYVKQEKLDKTQKLGLEAQHVIIRRHVTNSYSERFKIVDLTDRFFPSVFNCYDTKEVFELYQKVKMSDLKKVHPEAYKAYQDQKKKVAAANKKRKAAAVKAKATRKRKEIEKAKKLLEEAGEDA